jgi:hypothetical protein
MSHAEKRFHYFASSPIASSAGKCLVADSEPCATIQPFATPYHPDWAAAQREDYAG